jgi:recombination protein RecA
LAGKSQEGAAQAAPDLSRLYDAAVREYGLVDREPVPYVVPSGSRSIDRASGIGGYPGGRAVEVYGPEMSGKTTLALTACVNAQGMGLPFGYVDMEAVLDEGYFRALGVQGERNKDWLHVVPETGEDAFGILEDWISSGVKVLVVDSVARMTPKCEIEGDMGEANMGAQARMMGQGLRKITHLMYDKGALVIFINQTRQKIGVTFGNPEVTTGGNALKFYASMRLHIMQAGDPILDKEGATVGRFSKVTFKKNKCAPPLAVAQVPIVFGRGVAAEYELFDELLLGGIFGKKSSYYTYKGETFAGKANALDFIGSHAQELQAELDSKGA